MPPRYSYLGPTVTLGNSRLTSLSEWRLVEKERTVARPVRLLSDMPGNSFASVRKSQHSGGIERVFVPGPEQE